MAYIEIRIEEELEPYIDSFERVVYRGDKLQCCSPFRDDRNPSFAINLETGTWVDSGADDSGLQRGNFVKLLSMLQECSYEDALKYVVSKYCGTYADVSQLELKMKLSEPVRDTIAPVVDRPYGYSDYLHSRGITEPVQRLFATSESDGVLHLPVRDKRGRLVNLKNRKTSDKIFWYGTVRPVKDFLFGLDVVVSEGYDWCAITEGEIDAMYLWTIGVPAVATFGASITDKQLAQLKQLRRVVVVPDNDTVGRSHRNKVITQLLGEVEVAVLQYPKRFKDINELSVDQLKWVWYNKVTEVEVQFKL